MTATPASSPPGALPSFDEFLHGLADNVCAGLDLTVEQADGVRPMRYADLLELTFAEDACTTHRLVHDALLLRIARKRRQLQELWVRDLYMAVLRSAQ